MPKHSVDSGGVINISDDSSSDSDGMDTDSNSSPDSLLDNDDVIFVNHTSCQTGRVESFGRRQSERCTSRQGNNPVVVCFSLEFVPHR